jgi:hypothetical protein
MGWGLSIQMITGTVLGWTGMERFGVMGIEVGCGSWRLLTEYL